MEITQPLARAQESKRRRTLPLNPETLEMLRGFIQKDTTKGLIFGINLVLKELE